MNRDFNFEFTAIVENIYNINSIIENNNKIQINFKPQITEFQDPWTKTLQSCPTYYFATFTKEEFNNLNTIIQKGDKLNVKGNLTGDGFTKDSNGNYINREFIISKPTISFLS